MSSNLIQMIWDSFLETIIMVAISGGIGALAGIPLGILLFVTDRKSFLPMPGFNAVLGTVINALRSVPFIILLVAIIPFTRLIVGSSIGTAAAIVPLTLSVAPFIALVHFAQARLDDSGAKWTRASSRPPSRWVPRICRSSRRSCFPKPCPASSRA